MHAHQMKHPRRLLFDGACTTRAKNRLSFPDDLGLHEKIAERRMEGVGGCRRENHLGVAGDVDRPRTAGAVRDVDTPDLDIVFGRHDDLGMRLEIEIPAPKFRPPLREDRFIVFGLLERGLVRG